MTGIAIFFFIFAALIIWGGLVVATIALMRKPEVDEYPAGGEDQIVIGE
ncbi:MAG: methionine/alanine import family NSS transporter small subunit [Corynebacterium sp.]|nr:methionine/alanine import family NSS transporter small subunit [Corynebacterium sp.]